MKTLPPHGDLARLREHMRNRKAMNDIEHVCKFIADFSDPSDPDHAAGLVLGVGDRAQAIDCLDRRDDVGQQLPALVRDLGTGAAALEDLDPELALQIPHSR